jgi:FG-GAP-like repeat/Domain of unknown function DUF11/FG-GAP repeat
MAYGGDSNYAPATSATVVQSVTALPGGGFQIVGSYNAGDRPENVALGDFNGDGKLDLAIANFFSNNVSVLLGNGDGTFRSAVNYGAGVQPSSVVVGDFNQDGKADLAVANNGNVSILLGNGDGTFQAAVDYGTAVGGPLAVGDFNGDGKPDLVVAAYGAVSVLLGNGDGTFRTAANYGVGMYPMSLALGDFNGDGKADLAVANNGSGDVSVLLGNGDGTFRAPLNYRAGAGPTSLVVADFNADGKTDLAVANNLDSTASVLLGNGDGTFRPPMNYSPPDGAWSVAAADIDGDGIADLIVTYSTVSVFFGNGDGTFRGAVSYTAGAGAESVAVGDFNGDGITDLAGGAWSGPVSVLLGGTQAPDLSITIEHAGSFARGLSGATYTITVSNVGYASTSGTVTVTDSLSPGLVPISIEGNGWTCLLTTLTCTRADPLSKLASYPEITVTVSVSSGAPNGVTNGVTVSGGEEVNLTNDTTSDFTTTFTPGQIAQSWSPLRHLPLFSADYPHLLTGGTVMVHEYCSGTWYKLTPDSFGSYANGAWSEVAPMPPGYAPSAFSSAVLADGRMVVIGGEYKQSLRYTCGHQSGGDLQPNKQYLDDFTGSRGMDCDRGCTERSLAQRPVFIGGRECTRQHCPTRSRYFEVDQLERHGESQFLLRGGVDAVAGRHGAHGRCWRRTSVRTLSPPDRCMVVRWQHCSIADS